MFPKQNKQWGAAFKEMLYTQNCCKGKPNNLSHNNNMSGRNEYIIVDWYLSLKLLKSQESPPTRTQEAYCPPCSDYSFCCPNWVPPPPDLAGGVPYLGNLPVRVPPQAAYPSPSGRVPPDRVPPPGWTWKGIPLVSAPWHSGKCCKVLWDMGTPPLWTDRWKDRRVSKHYLPVVLRTTYVNMETMCSIQKLCEQSSLPLFSMICLVCHQYFCSFNFLRSVRTWRLRRNEALSVVFFLFWFWILLN